MFCNMARAYDELSHKLKAIVGDLHAVFDFNLVAGAKDRREAEELEELGNIEMVEAVDEVDGDNGALVLALPRSCNKIKNPQPRNRSRSRQLRPRRDSAKLISQPTVDNQPKPVVLLGDHKHPNDALAVGNEAN